MTLPKTPTPRAPITTASPRWLNAPTASADPCVWVACDESGRDADNLHGAALVFCLGSIRLADDRASAVVAELGTSLQGTTELKWSKVPPATRAQLIADLVTAVHAQGGDLSIVLMHNAFAAVAKTVDLLIEEHFHAKGVDLYGNGAARRMALFLFEAAPAALGDEWTRLSDAFISLHRRRHPKKSTESGIAKTTVDDFYGALETARIAVAPGPLHDLLTVLAMTREHADDLQLLLGEPGVGSFLDQHIPSIASTIRRWADPHLPVRLLHDDCPALLTEELLVSLEDQVSNPDEEWLRFLSPVALLPTVVGHSNDHPSLQLADLVAGAGRDVGLWIADGCPAGVFAETLAQLIIPSIDANQSVWYEPLPADCYDGS